MKDVRLPQSLQRAMAAEAEAAREARAKVIILLIFTLMIVVPFEYFQLHFVVYTRELMSPF